MGYVQNTQAVIVNKQEVLEAAPQDSIEVFFPHTVHPLTCTMNILKSLHCITNKMPYALTIQISAGNAQPSAFMDKLKNISIQYLTTLLCIKAG